MKTTIALMLLACAAGCAAGVHIVDVSGDARFQSGYRPGQVWRLRADGYLVQSRDNGWELWTAAEGAGQAGAIKVAAGSTVRIERLGYLFNAEHPPTPGGTTEMVWAYGTLTTPAGRPYPVTVLPQLRGGRPVAGTSLVVYPPNRALLAPVN